ncbi:MAG: hypothetical protein J5867_02495 [Prevotella sp.]|nr:hypothetical protein [Prevotella sp.]
MNELKPKIQLHAPASLKRNVMERIEKQRIRRKRIVAIRWCSVAAVALIGVMTFALWLRPSTEKPLVVSNHSSMPVVNEMPLPVVEDVKKTTILANNTMMSDRRQRENVSTKRPRKAIHPLPTPGKEEVSPKSDRHDEIIDVGFGREASSPINRADNSQDRVSPSHHPQPFTPEEQLLIDQMYQHRDIVNARLAEELEQASLIQQRLHRVAYEQLMQVRQLIHDATPKNTQDKMKNEVKTI